MKLHRQGSAPAACAAVLFIDDVGCDGDADDTQASDDELWSVIYKVDRFSIKTHKIKIKASESHPGGKLGFFAPNCQVHGIGGGEGDHKTA